MPRRTLKGEAGIAGVGLHTGAATRIRCLPAPAGTGIRFRRTDLEGQPEFPARVDEVDATERRTAIGHGPHTVHTVEHLLASVAALELDDLLIEVDGPYRYTDRFLLPAGTHIDFAHRVRPTATGSEVTFVVTMRGPTSLPVSLFVGPMLEKELPAVVEKLVSIAESDGRC